MCSVEHKVCTVCKIDKPITEFYKQKTSGDGHTSQCIECHKQKYRKNRVTLIHTSLQRQQEYRKIFYTLSPMEFRKYIRYEPDTGSFYKLDTEYACNVHDHSGYIIISLFGYHCQAQRLAYYLETGVWHQTIDHKDGVRDNNKWSNLRIANKRENATNNTKTRKGGLVGASFQKHRGNWQSYVGMNRKKEILGVYATEKEASLTYCRYVLSRGLVSREFLPAEFTDEELYGDTAPKRILK